MQTRNTVQYNILYLVRLATLLHPSSFVLKLVLSDNICTSMRRCPKDVKIRLLKIDLPPVSLPNPLRNTGRLILQSYRR